MPHRRSLALTWLLAASLAGAISCRRGSDPGAAPAPRPNVLLVTIDTLRADHVGCYGYTAAATPTLDALAGRGVRFETAVAPAPLTGPSHASILTGLTPLGHGFRNNSGFALPAEVRTVGQAFQKAGYRTAAFVSGFPLDRRFGFDRGFDEYDDHLPRGNDRRRTPYVERFADATTDAALRWLTARAGTGPWFLWIHYYDPHAPYEPPEDLLARFRAAPYDGEIAFVDRELHRLLEHLSGSGTLAGTLTVVTADHGESLGEHGEGTHGLFVYDATIKVPLVIAGPGIPAGRVSKTVARSIDIVPTLLDYAGIEAPRLDGRSLRPAADGQPLKDVPAYAESLYSELELGWAPLHSMRLGHLKLIDAPRAELYDLAADPRETVNRIDGDPTTAQHLRRGIQAELARTPPSAIAPADPEATRRLTALGYVSGNVQRQAGGAPLRDPKDGVRLMPRLNRGMSAARVDPELAIRELTSVLQDDPALLMARRTRAVAYEAAGRYDLAIADLRVLEKQGQLTAEDAVVLGDNLRFAGRLDEAAATLEQTSRENPTFAQPLLSLGEVRIRQQKYDEAAALFQRVLAMVPDHIEALRRLGDLDLLRANLPSAETRYSRIVALDGDDLQATTKLGVVKMRAGRSDDAIALFRHAIELDPNDADALLYMAGALASSGRPGEALPYFERSIKAGPPTTMALNGMGLTLLALGDRTRAAATFRQSLRLDPKQPQVAAKLAEIAR